MCNYTVVTVIFSFFLIQSSFLAFELTMFLRQPSKFLIVLMKLPTPMSLCTYLYSLDTSANTTTPYHTTHHQAKKKPSNIVYSNIYFYIHTFINCIYFFTFTHVMAITGMRTLSMKGLTEMQFEKKRQSILTSEQLWFGLLFLSLYEMLSQPERL